MKQEVISLPFKPRFYQLPIIDALENKGFKKLLCILPRRAGKDITAWNLAIRQCIRKPCVVFYVFPTFAQARRVIWQSVTNEGRTFLDFIPYELIKSTNSSDMSIRFVNGSLLQLVGSDNYDGLVGTNPSMCVFSEYALQDPRAYQFLRPILTVNDGAALFISTPRGKNAFWDLYQIALNSDEWFCYKLTINDTKHVSQEVIDKEREDGIMSEDLIQQEYYTSFECGVEGSYYAKYLDRMRLNNQIGVIPHQSNHVVHTAWDIGVRDSTSIVFFQCIGTSVHVIDYYENSKEGLEHYVKVLKSKDYLYGSHFAPHDIAVKEFGSGMTRIEKARTLGILFTIAPKVSIMDGIESVRSALSKIYIDEHKCAVLIKALMNYRQEYDHKRKVYMPHPLHDQYSHGCFTEDTLVLTRHGMRPIMLMKQGDEVLTLEGYKRCMTDAFMSRKNASLVEVLFQDGTKVKCTPDHLFLTENGWKSAENLVKGSVIQSSVPHSTNILMDTSIEFGQVIDILVREVQDCIEMYGKMHLEVFLQDVIYTIKTIIDSITTSGILNVCRYQNIYQNLNLIAKGLVILQENEQPNGILLRQELSGIKSMRQIVLLEEEVRGNKSIACIVGNYIKLLLEIVQEANKSFVIQTVRPLIIEGVKKVSTTSDVWDITVEDVHHFSLSNGAIVHNSDCFRYMCISLPKTRDSLTAEELDKRYAEAVYGDIQSPTPFDHGNRMIW